MPSNPTNTPTVRLSRTIRTVVIASKAWQHLLAQKFVSAYLGVSWHGVASRLCSLESRQDVNFWENFLLRFWRYPETAILSGRSGHSGPLAFGPSPSYSKIRSLLPLMATDRRPEFFKGGQLKVAIIGCGYVGLPLALRFAEAGHKVTGFDTDPEKVRMLNAGKSYIEHIQQTKIQQFVNSRHFNAVTDFSKLPEVDAIIICVPTPLNEYREPDLSYVTNTPNPIH